MAAIAPVAALATAGLAGYGAYQSDRASKLAEQRQQDADYQSQLAIQQRKDALQRTLGEMRSNLAGRVPTGYTPEEMKTLGDQVNFSTDAKGQDLAKSLLDSVTSRNINPASGAVTGAQGQIASDLAKYRSGKLLDIQLASMGQKRTEEAARRQAEDAVTQAESKGYNDLSEAELGNIDKQLGNFTTIQNQKSKTYGDLASSLLASQTELDSKDPFGIKKVGGAIGSLISKKKKLGTPTQTSMGYDDTSSYAT